MSERKTKVLLVEDEPSFADAIHLALEPEGFSIHSVNTGEQALAEVDAIEPDIVLLDMMLPKMSGIDVCREMRQRSSRLPIIMVTARNAEIDAVVALEVGADDYVTKPYRMRELIARMRCVLRRSNPDNAASAPDGVVTAGPVLLDANRHEVRVRNQPLNLPLKEFELLGMLMANAGRVMPRETLIRRVWGADYVGDTKTLDVHVKRLRSKIERQPSEPTLITTVRGLGYKFDPTESMADATVSQ